MANMLSVCGVDCSGCEFIKNSQCDGCSATEGKVFWTHHSGVEACPIYTCVKNEKKLDHCGSCAELPCDIWKKMKDPSWTDEQHQESIKKRVGILKSIK